MCSDTSCYRLGSRSFLVRLVFLLFALAPLFGTAFAGQVTLAWDAVANATGYKVHYGQSQTQYSATIDASNQLTYTVPSLTDGTRYYFAVSAYGPSGTLESGFSNEVNTVVQGSTVPQASFTATPSTGTAPLAVTLTDTSTGSVASRSWSLGDGTTATTQIVAKTYSAPGTYPVSLTVTGGGGSTTASQSINVSAAAPVADFSATPSAGAPPLAVTFSDSSSGTITSWSWQFGDGGTSSVKNPSYSYATAGTYAVTLNVTGPGGSNQVIKTGYITVTSPPGGGGGGGGAPANNTGLVAAFGFEEASGTQVIDVSGNANHGTISGGQRVTTNRFGSALKFDGIDDWVTVNDSASLDLSEALTLEAWVYPTVEMRGYHTLFFKELAEQGNGAYYFYANSDVGRPEANVFVGGAKTLVAGTHLPTNTWTHLATTYDGSTQNLYVDGALVGSRPQTGSVALSSGKLRIGGNSVWGDEYFAGHIDEVRVYNRALTQAEILADSKLAVVGLVVSTKSDRSASVPLNGLSVSGNIYISYKLLSPTASANPVKQVTFWLDDPKPNNPTGAPRQTERTSPFDFAGTLSNGTAAAFSTVGLTKGFHTVTARVTLKDGAVLPFITGSFMVQ
jgi:PKD repeat protein